MNKKEIASAAIKKVEGLLASKDADPQELADAIKAMNDAVADLAEDSSDDDASTDTPKDESKTDVGKTEDSTDDPEPKNDDKKQGTSDEDSIVDENKKKKEERQNMPIPLTKPRKVEVRDALNDFLHTKGEKRDGLTSSETGVLIPEEIIYNPEMEVNTVTDLAGMVTKEKVSVPSGKYPILKRASTTIPSVEELAQNPNLANPEFTEIDWKIVTYRGVIPISQESIDDSAIDLTSLVARHIQEIKVNTTNEKIATVLSGFKAQVLTVDGLVDELKTLKNKSFDPAYNLAWVMTQSLFDTLDKAKDNDGRYLLQDQIASDSGKSLFGLNVTVVEDTAFGGEVDSQQVWIGDLKRAVLFADRVDATARWVDNDIYGQVLQVVVRFDVEQADAEAGVFATLGASANPEE